MNFARYQSAPSSAFISGPREPNVVSGFGEFSVTQAATHPSNAITVGKHIFVVDSRQRDCKSYPNPSRYRIEAGPIKNVSSKIDLTISDSDMGKVALEGEGFSGAMEFTVKGGNPTAGDSDLIIFITYQLVEL